MNEVEYTRAGAGSMRTPGAWGAGLRSRIRRRFGWFTQDEALTIADSIAKLTCAAHVAAVDAASRECMTPDERAHFDRRVQFHMHQAAARDRADGRVA